MYNRLLVPLDGSDLAECALSHVAGLAAGCNVPEIDLLFVSEPPPPVEWVPYSRVISDLENERARMRDYLNKVAEDLRKDGVTVARPVIIEGPAASAITDYAADNGVDLIVMSTHGRSGPSKWAFGSVAEKVVRYSKVPVLIAVPKGCRLALEPGKTAEKPSEPEHEASR